MPKAKAANTDARNVFAARLRSLRQKKALSQEMLADLAGLHRTYVGSVERGERNISIDNMARLAKALGVPLVELLKERGAR
jgi:transcriptional regulator with XRE-family HTH domain